eukprot:Opistho-2@51346
MASEHLPHEHTQRPKVDAAVVAVAEEYFGSEIVRCTAHCRRLVALPKPHLGKPKIDQSHVTKQIKEHIFCLEVAVCNVERVQVFDREENFRGDKARAFFRQLALTLHVEVQVAAVNKFEHKIELGLGLECELQVRDEGVRQARHDVLFLHKRRVVLAVANILAHNLHRKNAPGILLANLHDLSECTASNNREDFKVGNGDRLPNLLKLDCHSQLAAGLLSRACQQRPRLRHGAPFRQRRYRHRNHPEEIIFQEKLPIVHGNNNVLACHGHIEYELLVPQRRFCLLYLLGRTLLLAHRHNRKGVSHSAQMLAVPDSHS